MTNDPHAGGRVLSAGKPVAQAEGAVILLHGRGGSAEDILSLAGPMNAPNLAFLAPEAAGNTWYPNSFLAPRETNEPWLSSALNRIATLIAETGLPPERIVLAGFSQGACLASTFVASYPAPYGGLIALTGGIVGPPGTKYTYSGNLSGMPALLLSGVPDPHIPWERVEETAEVLTGMGAKVTMRQYPGRQHTVSMNEIELAHQLLAAAFPV